MVIVDCWVSNDCNLEIGFLLEDGLSVTLKGVIDDEFDLDRDPELVKDVLINDHGFKPKKETLYEVYLRRARIQSDLEPEESFVVEMVIEKEYKEGRWVTPVVNL